MTSRIVSSLTLIFFSFAAAAQVTIVKNKTPFKPPVVQSFLGVHAGSDTVQLEEAAQIIKLPLVVKDGKGNTFKIENYRFLYRRKGFIENAETGRPEVHYTTVAARFDTVSLPKIWLQNIGLTLQSGDELFYFEILAADKEGKLFYAPDVKIIVR